MRVISQFIALALFASVLSAQSGGTLTQLVNNTLITNGMVTCNTGGTAGAPQYHVQNSFWRAYRPSDSGVVQPITVTCITYAVEYALAGAAANPPLTQPLEIRLRVAANTAPTTFPAAIPAITHTEIFNQPNVAPNAAQRIFTRGINALTPIVLNPNDLLVVELYLPDGVAGQNVLFPGKNGLGETAQGYLSAPGCGMTAPTPFAGIGFPNVHLLLDVNYNFVGATPAPIVSATSVPNIANPGMSDLTLVNTSLTPGHEIWNIWSWQPCPGGVGTGSFLGLCFGSISDVMPQLMTPVGIPPFHFIADNCSMTFGPFLVPSGIPIEIVTVDYNSMTLSLNGWSPAINVML